MLKEYIAYLKDNPKGYWFRRKLYGWGWTPVKWQGWVTIAAYIVLVLGVVIPLSAKAETGQNMLYAILATMVIATTALIAICYWKGESPRWQWGLPKKK